MLTPSEMKDRMHELARNEGNIADIRKQTELTFPMARRFVRPGFDK